MCNPRRICTPATAHLVGVTHEQIREHGADVDCETIAPRPTPLDEIMLIEGSTDGATVRSPREVAMSDEAKQLAAVARARVSSPAVNESRRTTGGAAHRRSDCPMHLPLSLARVPIGLMR